MAKTLYLEERHPMNIFVRMTLRALLPPKEFLAGLNKTISEVLICITMPMIIPVEILLKIELLNLFCY